MSKLVLIDGNSIAYRAFFALPLLSNSSGVYTNAAYGFTTMLLKVIEEEKPSHILVAFDAGKTTFRHKDYKEYKGKREKTPIELSEQLPLIKDILDAFQIRYFEMMDYEADDIIGTLSKQAESQQLDTVIISGDKDMLQLVNNHVHVCIPRKGLSDAVRYDLKKVDEKYGLTPKQIIDLKGLMGDTSDNIPGIPGVGEKTALKLLHQFSSVEEVLEHIDEISGKKLREKVREHHDQALLSKKLATIHCDVSLDFSLEELVYPGPDVVKLAEQFKKLEFKSLLDRLEKEVGEELTTIAYQDVKYTIITADNQKEFHSFFDKRALAFFVEATSENPHHAEVIGFSLSDGEESLFIPQEIALDWEVFDQWLGDPERTKLVYDSKKIKILLKNHQKTIKGIQFDTLIAAYLLNPSETQLELSEVASKYLGPTLPSDEEVYGKGAKRRVLQEEELAQHLARKTMTIFRISPVLLQEIQATDLNSLLFDMEMPLANVLADMELQGVYIDQKRLEELGIELKDTLDRLTDEIYEIAGTQFNINSPKQLGEILFDKLGLPVLKKTKTGYSTSADVLEKLAPQHEIVEKILHFRQVGKLHSTYIEGLKKEIGKDGKIHTQFHQTITATGRLSSTEPNLQNIPIRLEEGRRIRQVFTPSNRDWLMLSADYSQIELRVLAHLSKDQTLITAFNEGRDIHTQTAMDIFEVGADEVTSLMRRHAKAVNFGIVYGISDFGLSQNLGISRAEAKEFIERYFKRYPGVKNYMDEAVEQAKKDGFVTTLLNRRRYLPDIRSSNFTKRSFAERTAMNTPIQGTAADIIKYAMIELNQKMKEQNLHSRLLLQVHDELVFELPPSELEIIRTLVPEVMENALQLSVPLKVDVNYGENWYEAK
ncbi:DNA polymerase I [Thermoflavimicrobium daqui]|uniref:DNA polymerase I n=1 Tax=Thermoflavimicrobium daqui TaxID=2137476 RepID=A0A364KA40_9BACL|nr:DNA polymerase I [Thermoflavimicrobium daqui]RAL27110.1 DNA polymerase I [Thermoflavimicrobium daqui]